MASSGNALFDRRCRLTISNPTDEAGNFSTTKSQSVEIDGGTTDRTDVPGMRVSFKITKTLKKEPNTSEIIVSNLSQTTRSSLQTKGVRVILEAGYKEAGVFRIFSGDVRTIDHVRNGSDWDTTMRLGDGERSWKYARLYESFAVGTPAASVLKTIARAMGLGMGNVDNAASGIGQNFDQGFAVAGSCSKSLDKIVKSLRKTWSVQDGELQILDPGQTLDLSIPEIRPFTGLVGSPEMGTPQAKGKPALVKFKSLLISTKPGAKVKLISDRYNGFVSVVACSFEGDTHGGPWYTEISGVLSQ